MDVVVPADAAEYCDDSRVNDAHNGAHNDAYNDARYDTQRDDAEPADEALRAGAAEQEDVVVPGLMHIYLLTGICMRICISSWYMMCKSHTSTASSYSLYNKCL